LFVPESSGSGRVVPGAVEPPDPDDVPVAGGADIDPLLATRASHFWSTATWAGVRPEVGGVVPLVVPVPLGTEPPVPGAVWWWWWVVAPDPGMVPRGVPVDG
jgi:hypothetical protein